MSSSCASKAFVGAGREEKRPESKDLGVQYDVKSDCAAGDDAEGDVGGGDAGGDGGSTYSSSTVEILLGGDKAADSSSSSERADACRLATAASSYGLSSGTSIASSESIPDAFCGRGIAGISSDKSKTLVRCEELGSNSNELDGVAERDCEPIELAAVSCSICSTNSGEMSCVWPLRLRSRLRLAEMLGLMSLKASLEKNRTFCPVPGVLGSRRIERIELLASLRETGVLGWTRSCPTRRAFEDDVDASLRAG